MKGRVTILLFLTMGVFCAVAQASTFILKNDIPCSVRTTADNQMRIVIGFDEDKCIFERSKELQGVVVSAFTTFLKTDYQAAIDERLRQEAEAKEKEASQVRSAAEWARINRINMLKRVTNEVKPFVFNTMLQNLPLVTATNQNLTIKCDKADFKVALDIASSALVTGDVSVRDAEKLVLAARREKRLFNANLVNQLYSAGLKRLYTSSSPIVKRFDTDRLTLKNASYNDILVSQIDHLRADMYKIQVSGNVDVATVQESLEESFGNLKSLDVSMFDIPLAKEDELLPFRKNEQLKVQLFHTFAARGKRDDAMPAKLIPTTIFNDPALIFIKRGDANKTEFKRIVKNLAATMASKKGNTFEEITIRSTDDYECLVFTKVRSKTALQDLYRSSVKYDHKSLVDNPTLTVLSVD